MIRGVSRGGGGDQEGHRGVSDKLNMEFWFELGIFPAGNSCTFTKIITGFHLGSFITIFRTHSARSAQMIVRNVYQTGTSIYPFTETCKYEVWKVVISFSSA